MKLAERVADPPTPQKDETAGKVGLEGGTAGKLFIR